MPFELEPVAQRFRRLAPAADHCSLRVVEEISETTSVRQDVAEPSSRAVDRGAMVTVIEGDGIGYGASADLTDAGLKTAIDDALHWARLSKGRSVFADGPPRLAHADGSYRRGQSQALGWSKSERIEALMAESKACPIDDRIVDWQASLWTVHTRELLAEAGGAVAQQEWDFTIPALHVVAHAGGVTQTRSWGGRGNGFCQQGGADVIERSGFIGSGRHTAEEALQLATAPNCPSGRMDVLLMPDQMMLQIHESIGHPLELDRILGDERNYAGTSFVTLDMLGSYRYGSPLLNVTYDPTLEFEFASFRFDHEGSRAERQFLIRDGILLRPLGGTLSQQRAGAAGAAAVQGVATARASSWNRPPIDRMSNLNVEPGASTLAQMIESIERGVLLRTNSSWSIDDSRNKFQFGCEWGQVIRNGRLAEVVRNPNYRGISATFWRSLAMVGDRSTFEVLGSPFCGKGEPNQLIRVGHASPACKFSGVDVFGAER